MAPILPYSAREPAALAQHSHLTLYAAQLASAACNARATAMGQPQNIAIVDASLHLLHFQRMTGAKYTSINIAIDKAFTAAGHRLGTHAYKEKVRPGDPAYGIWNSNGGRFTVIGGGLPIEVDGVVVGAIGCSTGTPAQDQEVAQAGVDAVMNYVRKHDGGRPKAKL